MNVSIDLIIPPVIFGILITMIVSVNVMMMESSIENGAIHRLQTSANNAVLVVQEETKYLKGVTSVGNGRLEFVEQLTEVSDTIYVQIYRDGEYLSVSRTATGRPIATEQYYLKLDSLGFQYAVHAATSTPFLEVTVVTASSASEQTNSDRQFKASAERSIYLKNLHISSSL